MSIYLIEHQVKDFTGFFGGVDFYHGRGSTGSEGDAEKLKKLGCRVRESGTETIESQDKGAEDPAPASLSQEETTRVLTVAGEAIRAEKKKPGRKPKVPK
jgi:hypothetical protein